MKLGALALLCAATAFAVARAQSTQASFPNFPYCQCIKSPSPYSVDPRVKSFGNGTYCFTLKVQQPSPNATGYCAAKADVKKMEFNVYKTCDVFGSVANATLNGVPTKVGPNFDPPAQGPADAMILRLTQLNLDLTSDGAEICLTLGINERGRGCDTLEKLCVPPAGSAPGTCSIALFDSQTNCCPIRQVGVLQPPPPPPSPLPPSPPPPPPPSPPTPDTCTSCAYLTIGDDPINALVPATFTPSMCSNFISDANDTLYAEAAKVGAVLLGTPTISCTSKTIKICVKFASIIDGSKLDANSLAAQLLSLFLPGACPAWLYGRTVFMTIAGDGPDLLNPPTGDCLNGLSAITCTRRKVDFPKCECVTAERATPFAALPILTAEPGRPSNKTNSTLFCFTLKVITPSAPNSFCANATTLLKAEIWGNDIATQRRKILALSFQAANSTMKFISPSWGTTGEQTLKVSPLNWSTAEADGAKVCLELSSATDLKTFCNTSEDTCWINLFSPTKECCPLYAASLLP